MSKLLSSSAAAKRVAASLPLHWPLPRQFPIGMGNMANAADAARIGIPVLDFGANGNDDRCVGRVNRDQRSETLLRSTVTVSESPKSCLSVVYTSDVAPRPRV